MDRMHTNKGKLVLETDGLTESIIGCAFAVSNGLKAGFLEKVYENALTLELRAAGHAVQQQAPASVFYRGELVGDYRADLIVEDTILVELKAVRSLDPSHHAQCYNYLHATNLEVCLLMNFGRPKLEFKRILRTPSSV